MFRAWRSPSSSLKALYSFARCEVAIVFGFQVQRNVCAPLCQRRHDTLAFTQRTKLFGAADLRGIRTGSKQRQDEFGSVESDLDFCRPHSSAR